MELQCDITHITQCNLHKEPLTSQMVVPTQLRKADLPAPAADKLHAILCVISSTELRAHLVLLAG